jgi:serine/threonine protein kinase
VVSVVEQILASLASLEEINRAHCDVKPENILIMNSKTLAVKLCDVGSSKVVSKESLEEATILGTVPFLAPELIRIKGTKIVGNRAFKSDVFSFGLVVLYIITHKKFKSHERLEVE